HGRRARPPAVPFGQAPRDGSPSGLVDATLGYNETPRLTVEARGSPAGRLEHPLEVCARHRPSRIERARAPAVRQQIIDWRTWVRALRAHDSCHLQFGKVTQR